MGALRRNVVPFVSGMAGVVVGSMLFGGVVYAANGGSFILGRSNSATATSALTNTAGTPLSLIAKAGTPPLKVNTAVKVPNLNADRLDGLDSTAFQRAGTKAADSSKLEGKTLSQVADAVRSSMGLSFQRSEALGPIYIYKGVASNAASSAFIGTIQGTVTPSCSTATPANVDVALVVLPASGGLQQVTTNSTLTGCNQPWTVTTDVTLAAGDKLAVITDTPVTALTISLVSPPGPGTL